MVYNVNTINYPSCYESFLIPQVHHIKLHFLWFKLIKSCIAKMKPKNERIKSPHSRARTIKNYNICVIVEMTMQDSELEQLYVMDESRVASDLSEALQILAKVSPSSPEVKKSNEIIIRHLTQPDSLRILISLLIQSGEDQTKCSLIISFITYYLKIQVRPGVGIIRHDKKVIFQKVKALFFCETVSNKHKKMLSVPFSEFLATLTPDFIRIRKTLCNQIVSIFLNESKITVNDISNISYLIEAILTPSLESQSLKILEENLLANFIKLSLQQIRELDGIILNSQNGKMQPENQLKLDWALKVHKITSLLFLSANIDKVYTLKTAMILSSNLANLCTVSLRLSPKANSFIISSDQLEQFQSVNEIKVQTLKIMEDYLKLLIKANKNLSDAKYIPVEETIRNFLGIISILANEIVQYPRKPIASTQLAKKTMVVLSKIAKIPFFLNQMTELRDIAIFKVCFPCLLTTPQDLHLAAQDYCNKRQKMINYQEVNNVHQAAASLIEFYADQIYGTVPYLVKSIINLIDFQLTADPRYFELIPSALLNSQLYTKYSYFEQIQLGLSVLALLSYHADNRDDIAADIEELIVRRQEFFSRIDVPEHLIVSFLSFCSYYAQNFYQLILKGKANGGFHRSLLFHAMELLNASYNETTKTYINNDAKKIGIQVLDYLSNALVQPLFFSAVFPAWNPESTAALVSLIDKLCRYFDSTSNVTVLESVLIDFVTRVIERHYKQENNYIGMPEVFRREIAQLLAQKIVLNFRPGIKNQQIAKAKMLQIYSLLLIYCENPLKLMEIVAGLIDHIVQKQYSSIEEALNLIQVFLKRAVKENIILPPLVQNITTKCVIKAMKVCDNQKYQNQVFDVVLNMNLLKIHQEEIAASLLEDFQERLQELQTDEQAQILMEKILYLLLQIAFSNFNLVSPGLWLKIMDQMIQFMRVHYKRQDTTTVGKATCICLCCYIQEPEGFENYLQNRLQGFWDCVLDDHLKYSSQIEKKIFCLILLNFMAKYSHRPIIKDKFPAMLKSVCTIMYFIYEKNEISWKSEESDSDNDNESKSDNQQSKPWRDPFNTMRQNKFLSDLPDERILLRDICLQLKENDLKNFERFLHDLPIGLQNLVKNKIMMYRGEPALANKKKIRTILKVKKQDES